MLKQTVIWTALPDGVVSREGSDFLRLSVFVSPRLEASESSGRQTLGSYPDFLTWPQTLEGIEVRVRFDNRDPVPAQRVAPAAPPPPSQLWGALFSAGTSVKPYTFPDPSPRPILSYPVRNVLFRLKEVYQSAALDSPLRPPVLELEAPGSGPMRNLLREINLTPDQSRTLNLQMRQQLQGAEVKGLGVQQYLPEAVAPPILRQPLRPGANLQQAPRPVAARVFQPPAAMSAAAVDFNLAHSFHTGIDMAALQRPSLAHLVEQTDFHQIVSSLGQYPDLMRRLGLVLDLEVPLDNALLTATRVRVVVSWTPQRSTENVTPATACQISKTGFAAVPRPGDSDLGDGMLKLEDATRFEVGQADVDSAAIKTLEMAQKVALTLPLATAQPRTGAAVRAVGTQALISTRVLALAAEVAPPPPPEPTPLPSLRSAGIWVARVERAAQTSALLLRAATLNNALVLHAGPPEEPPLYAEDVTRGYRVDVWDEAAKGWHSLCRRIGSYSFTRAGVSVEATDEGWISSAATEGATEGAEMYQHECLFRWEGWSLCAPRPGRAVAEEGVAATAPDQFGLQTAFQPVPGSLPRLRFGKEYRLRARLVDLAGNSLPHDTTADEHASASITYFRQEPVPSPTLVPFSDISESPGESVDNLVIRSFNSAPPRDTVKTEDLSQRHVAAPQTSQEMAETHGMFDAPEGMKGDAATWQLILDNAGQFGEFISALRAQLPYLPDSIALGVLVRVRYLNSPEVPDEWSRRIPFDGTWPDFPTFRLVAFEPEGPRTRPEWDAERFALKVPLQKAWQAEVELSCYVAEQQVPNLGMWRWTAERVVHPALAASRVGLPQARQIERTLHRPGALATIASQVNLPAAQVSKLQEIGQAAQEGRTWLLTPSRTVRLMHAVQQPLVTPEFQNLTAHRQLGDTFALFSDKLPVSGRSTAKLDVSAEWQEPVDELDRDGPRVVEGRAQPFEIPLEPVDGEVELPVPNFAGPGPVERRFRHSFGDTKRRKVKYRAVATSRFREYLPPDQVESGALDLAREGPPADVDVPNAARPAAPRLQYVIPVFEWARSENTSTRSGGGLRIYLDRPWYSSGEGELLGVVIPNPASGALTVATMLRGLGTTQLPNYLTFWGQDPIWDTARMTDNPTIESFRNPVATATNLTLEEVPGARVAAVGYEVFYDAERRLWYSDLALNPGDSYFPFVRLALVRFQPHSIANAHLSRVVRADFAQLVAERNVSVSRDSGNPRLVTVSVSGPTYTASGVGRGPSEMEAMVERQVPNVPEPLNWAPALNEPINLPHSGGRLGQVEVLRQPRDPVIAPRATEGVGPVLRAPAAVLLRGSYWNGQVTLPEGPGPFRVVIREYERFIGDASQSVVTGAARIWTGTERRLVFADAFVLS